MRTGTCYDNVNKFVTMCVIEIERCPECKRKHTYTPSFCEKYQKGIICVSDDVPARRDPGTSQSTLRATVRFDDRFGKRVLYLSDIMDVNQYDYPCSSCIEDTTEGAESQ
jgi:hypothetical protein